MRRTLFASIFGRHRSRRPVIGWSGPADHHTGQADLDDRIRRTNHPSDGVIQDLWAKALAIEAARGAKTVLVTMDLACISKAFADGVAERIAKQWSIPRERVMLNVSHNHSGPLLEARYPNGPLVFDMNPAEWRQVQDYTRWLGDATPAVVAV